MQQLTAHHTFIEIYRQDNPLVQEILKEQIWTNLDVLTILVSHDLPFLFLNFWFHSFWQSFHFLSKWINLNDWRMNTLNIALIWYRPEHYWIRHAANLLWVLYVPTNVNSTRATLIKVDLGKIRTFSFASCKVVKDAKAEWLYLINVFYGYCPQTPY